MDFRPVVMVFRSKHLLVSGDFFAYGLPSVFSATFREAFTLSHRFAQSGQDDVSVGSLAFNFGKGHVMVRLKHNESASVVLSASFPFVMSSDEGEGDVGLSRNAAPIGDSEGSRS